MGTIGLSDTDVQSALIDAYHAGVDRDALRFVTIALLNRCAPVGQSWNDDRGYEG